MPVLYLIWSNEHRSWWGPNSQGYVSFIDLAGRYTKEEAGEICAGANYGLGTQRPNEVMVLAPEYSAS